MAEAELIARAYDGDAAAWSELVPAHQAAVYRLAYLILGSAADAEDVAQEAFVRAWRSLDAFDRSRPLRPWLLAITANLARNRRRSLGRYLAALGRAFAAAPIDKPDLLAAGRQAEEAHALWQAVRRLASADQEIIYLRFFLDLTVAETAQALQVAEGTVKSRLHRALGRLRRTIEKEFPDLREGYHDERSTLAGE